MVERIIELSVRHKWVVFGVVFALALWAADSARKTPLDAVPDLSDPQVIVYTEWMGRSPDLVEDQITYPLIRALQSTPGVQTVRGYSMFGMSFTYVLFDEGTDMYWARTRVLEQLGRVQQQLPPGVSPTLGHSRTSPFVRLCRPCQALRRSHRSVDSSASIKSSSIPTGWSVTDSRWRTSRGRYATRTPRLELACSSLPGASTWCAGAGT
jgi:hypothetical protein